MNSFIRMKYRIILIILFIGILSLTCLYTLKDLFYNENLPSEEEFSICPLSDGFDFPVGKPNAKKYYDAQSFGVNDHLGEDWNGKGGGNTDLNDPVFSVSDGVVFWTKDRGGKWGNIVRILHKVDNSNYPQYIESFYAHLEKILVKKGDIVKRGTQIGTIGNVGGIYFAHLHLEFRNKLGMEIGGGYSSIQEGYISPTQFIKAHRPKK